MSQLVALVLLVLILPLALVNVAGNERTAHASSSRDGRADDIHTRSARVDLTQLPGMTFTADELSREEHWTGMLPVDARPTETSTSRHAHHPKDSDTSTGSGQLFYWLIKSRHHTNRRDGYDKDDSGSDSGSRDGIDSDAAPLVIWINGGPGCSSMGGLLEEHGPFFLERNPDTHSTRHHNPHPYRLVYNQYSWSNYADMIYIDQPVGVGFSHLHDRHDLVHTEGRVAEDFYNALTYFLTHHHTDYQHRKIYLSGESYAAKYIPAMAGYILNQNRCLHKHKPALDDSDWVHYNNTFYSLGLPTSCPPSDSTAAPVVHVHLAGLLIGNGDYSPLLQRFASRPITLSLGLMDVKQANQYSYLEEVCMADLRKAVVRTHTHRRCTVCYPCFG